MTVKAYYIRYNSTNYAILEFDHKEGGTNKVDTTRILMSRAYDSTFEIGTDISVGYLDAGDSFVAEFNGDIVSTAKNEVLEIEMESYGGRINRTEHITQIYEDKSPEYIVEDLIDNDVDGLTYASSNASGVTISKFVMNSETAGEAIMRILKELDWQIRVDTSKNFYFEPKGDQVASIELTIGTNAYMEDTWKKSPTNLINYITIVGDNARFSTSKTTASGDSQTEFTVDHKIIGNVKVTVEGVEKTGGVASGTASYDYTVDKENKKIIFKTGQTLNESVIVYYEYEIPIKVSAKADESVTDYTRFPKKFSDPNIKTMAQARAFAKKILKTYGSPVKNGRLTLMWETDVSVGDTIRVIDSFNSIDQEFVVTGKRKKYPDGLQSIEVGVDPIDLLSWNKTMDARVKNLEAKQDNSDLLQKYLGFKESLDIVVKQGRLRVRTETIGHSWIVGSSTNGIVGANTNTQDGEQQTVGEGGRVMTISSITNYQDTMYERFNFTTYDDTGTTTATWDTTNEQCTFTNGEIAASLATAKRASNFTSATLTASSTTNLAFHLSADGGSHWESVTSGSEHSFTNAGTDLRWKATASGVATLTNIKIQY